MKKVKKTRAISRNPAGRPKDPEKRQAILNAAEMLFTRHGFEHASMDTIAKQANVSKLTVYSHFSDKDDLFKAVIKRKCAQHNMPDTFMALAHVDVEKALSIIAQNLLKLIYSKEAISMQRIIQTESARHPKIAELFYEAGPQRVKAAFDQLLHVWIKNKKLLIPDIELARDHFFSILKGECHFLVTIGLGKVPTQKEITRHINSCIHMFIKTYGV